MSKSAFMLSFEKIALEDVQKEWDDVEELREQLAQRRELAAAKNRHAQELLRAVDGINMEIATIEQKLSAALTIMVQKRRRSEASLRELVLQWEREKISDVASHDSSLKLAHREQVDGLTRKVNKLTEALEERDHVIAALRHEAAVQRELLSAAHAERSQMEKRLERLTYDEHHHLSSASPRSASVSVAKKSVTEAVAADTSSGNITGAEAMRVAQLEAQVAALASTLKMKDSALEAVKSHLHQQQQQQHPLQAHHFVVGNGGGAGGGGGGSVSSGSRSPSGGSTQQGATATADVYTTYSNDRGGGGGGVFTSSTTASQRSVSAASSSAMTGTATSATNQLHPEARNLLGLELTGRRQQRGLPGVHILDVLPGGPADEAGITASSGEVIVKWGGCPVNSLDDIHAASETIVPNSFLAIQLATPSATNPEVFDRVRDVRIFITGNVGPHHHRTQRYTTTASTTVTSTSTSSSTMNTADTSSSAAAMTRAERMERFLREH